MLQRSSQVGEFYRMMPPAVWNKNKLLPSQYLDLLIYDEEADQLKHIDFEQALFATGAGGPGLDPAQLLGDDFGQQRTAAGAADFEANGASAAQAAEAATALGLLLAAGGKTVPNIVRCVKAGVWLPVCITIVRPFIEHLMMSTVCTVSGRDTGATLFGPADMQISANTSVKTIEGHYTCHTKSVITKPQNVYVMRDVMCSGYVAGGNCRFFGMPAGAGKFDGPADRGNIQRSLNERLSFADDASGEYASMLAFLSPYSDEVNSSRDQIISISDRLLPWEVSKNADPAKKYFPGGQTGYNTYAQQWNLGQIHFGEDVRATENMAFMSQGAVNNSLCVLGPHRRYNPFVTLHVTREPSTFGYRGKCWLCPSRLLPAWLAASASAQWYRLRHLLHLRRRTSSSWCPARATLARTRSPGCAPRPSQLFPPCSLTHSLHNLNYASVALAVAGCEVEARRVGLAQDRARLDGLARGGGALAARDAQVERHLSARRRARQGRRPGPRGMRPSELCTRTLGRRPRRTLVRCVGRV